MELEKRGSSALVPSAHKAVEFDASDILVPKLLISQPTSGFEEVPQGVIVRSTDTANLGPKVDIIPLATFKTWTVFEMGGSKPQWKRTEPCNYKNKDLPWEFEENGEQMRRDQVLNFYCLIPTDIDREMAALSSADPDPDDALLPIVVSFSRTSYKAGRELISHFAKCERFNVPPSSKVFTLSLELQKSEKGKWYTWKVESKEKSTPAHRELCAKWKNIIGQSNVQVHEVGDDAPTEVSEPVSTGRRVSDEELANSAF